MAREKLYLVGDARNPRVREVLRDLDPWLRKRARVVGVFDSLEREFDPGDADLILVAGGDGALLAAASRLEGRPIPLLGIRVGTFGFLAELDPGNCRPYLERILAGEGRLEARLVLRCEVSRGDGRVEPQRALNDAVVTARVPARMLTLELAIDGEPVATYRGDGLVVSTPLGSTAHSLAAGGPVVEPDADLILVTPLAPHTLSSRPLVLDAKRRLAIRLVGHRNREAALSLDGQRTILVEPDDCVRIERCAESIRLLTIVERSFFQTLREKFRWGGSASIDPDRRDGSA